MKSVSAHVKNGQIVPDEPVELYDGDAVQVLVPDDDDYEMTAEELKELDAALDESEAQFKRGEYVDARAFVLELLARS
jgi:hypothetical protein